MPTPAEELAEWAAARTGDRKAVDALLRRHQRDVYRFGLRMCGDEDAAREVLQNTLLSAFTGLGSFRGESRLSTWLYALARSHCSRLHRRTRSAPIHDVPLAEADEADRLASAEPAADEAARRDEMARLVSTAIGMLSESHREAVVLKDVEDLPLEEAAKVAGLAVPAFKSRLHRAREQLKEHLAALIQEQPAESGVAACPTLQRVLRESRTTHVDRAVCRAIEEHLQQCALCRDRMGPLQSAASLCRRLPKGDEVPAAVQRAVRTAVLNATSA